MDFRRSLSSIGRALKNSGERTWKKSTVLLDVSRINILIASKEKDIEDIYIIIGKNIYEKYGKDFNKHKDLRELNDLKELFTEIAIIEKEIKKLKKKISHIKDQRICPYCGEITENKSKFCLKCDKML
ncbi:hypothetical protein [Clostridium polynesiense]|uniref:hypothetical protein n=1 Tax=Clostridium polynesiense TaxID=1325933 RepID=UPI00058E55FD|nr:hypothetical protein [Clostridium polynesiense]